MKTMQTLSVNLLVLGIFLAAVWYFNPQIPELHFGSAVYKVAQPPLWSLAATLGGGLLLLIISSVALGAKKISDEDKTVE